MTMLARRSIPFRFDKINHEYIELATGIVLPHCTELLEACGLVDSEFYTEASRQRGTAVHALCADYDLGALDPAKCVSVYRGYLLAHVKAMGILKAQGLDIHAVEEPLVHPDFRYGVRPDRDVTLGLRGVLEIKSGAPEKSHQVQTALQAMAVSVEAGLPATSLGRWCLYLKSNGKFRLEEHRDKRDFATALQVIRATCRE